MNEPAMPANDVAIACSLSAAKLSARNDELAEIFEQYQQIQELPDGYAFQYPGDALWLNKLTSFILAERVKEMLKGKSGCRGVIHHARLGQRAR